MFHHPLVTVVAAWWLLVAIVVQLSGSTMIVATTSIVGPSLAVFLAYRLTARTQRVIDAKLEAQNAESALREQAARRAVEEAQQTAGIAKVTADETHKLVNSQKDDLERQKSELEGALAARDSRIAALEARLDERGMLPAV